MRSRSVKIHLVLALLLLTALTLTPQVIFGADNTAQASVVPTRASDAETTLPVGGWSPEEIHIINDDVKVKNASELPVFRRGAFSADSVFTKGVSTVGYDALTTDAERNYYKALENEAIAFMNAREDLKATEMKTNAGMTYKYVIAQLNFEDYGINNYEEASHAYYAFDYDHPAYYWVSNTVLSSGACFYLTTEEEYSSVDERARINSLVESGVKDYIAKAENGADTLDKIAIIHDQIVTAVDYAFQDDGKTAVKAKWAHGVHGVFDQDLRKVVCEGYADAFALIMNYMGIPNYYIVGSEGMKGGGHVWNAVSANDGESYLYVDLTWDDLGKDGYTYEYFGMPSTDFEDLHYKYVPTGKRNRWLYPVTVNINDELAGAYYSRGGYYCDSTGSKMNDIVVKGRTKAGRIGSHVSFMAPARKLNVITALSTTLGISNNSYRTISYKGTNYRVVVSKISDHRVDLSAAEITLSNTAYTYTADPIEPKPVVTCNGVKLIEGVNYTLSYDNNIEVSERAGLTATGIGNFTGSASANFTIYPHVHNMTGHPAIAATCTEAGSSAYWYCDTCRKYFADEDATAEIDDGSWVINALDHEWDEGVVTTKPTYTSAGIRTFTCKHDPTHTKTENIPMLTPKTIVPKVTLSSAALTYNGKDQVPDVTVKDGNQILREKTDYIIDRKPSKTVGTYSLRVTLKNAYSGSVKVTYTIIPKGTTITKLLKGTKQMTAKWKKQSAQVTGYQICYSLKKNFGSGVKTVTVKKANTVKKVIRKLKANKTYYVRIRTYKKIGDRCYYSAWSKAKSVKTK